MAYVSKRMQTVAQNNYTAKLELCGLAINTARFSHLLKRVHFDAKVDHLAITPIMKSRPELTTNKIKWLLEVLSVYIFSPYYLKGNDMVHSDFISRMERNKSDPHEVIPILLILTPS